jgi:hypothetical protein
MSESLVLPALQWLPGKWYDKGKAHYWDTDTLIKCYVNLVSVAYRPLNDNGEQMGRSWHIPPDMYKKIMDSCKEDIEKCREADIDIIGYIDTVQFNAEIVKERGIRPEDIVTKSADGKYGLMDYWDSGNYVACINRPKWREIQSEILRITAEAGMKYIMFDLYPYVGGYGYFCHCENCLELWNEYCMKKNGTTQPMPTNGFDFTDSLHQQLFEFRMECFKSFYDDVQCEARKVNPDFRALQNNNISFTDIYWQCLNGVHNPPTSEFMPVDTANESTLFMYGIAEALGSKILLTYYNFPEQMSKYKVNTAESVARCGGMMAPVAHPEGQEIARKLYGFMKKHSNIYINSLPAADTAVLFSWKSTVYTPNDLDVRNMLIPWEKFACRRVAAALNKLGIPHDFVAAESKSFRHELERFKTLIIPDYADFYDKWIYDVMDFASCGRNIIVLGEASCRYIRQFSRGMEEKITYVDEYQAGTSEQDMVLTTGFINAAIKNNLFEQLSFKNFNEAGFNATVRTVNGNQYIHILVTGKASEKLAEAYFDLPMPNNKKIPRISALCPYTEDENIPVSMHYSGNRLNISTGKFDTYLVLAVDSC